MVRGDNATHEEKFPSNWFREAVDGNAEEREKGKKENQSGRRQGWAKRGGERIGKGRDEQQNGSKYERSLGESEVFSVSEVGSAGSIGFHSENVPDGVCELAVSPGVECDISAVLSSKCHFNPSVSQILSCSEKRGTSGTLSESEQPQKARMNVERPPAKAVPESLRRRPTPEVSPYKAVPECISLRPSRYSRLGGR